MPSLALVTFTEITHELFAAITPPEKLSEVAPDVGVGEKVPAPHPEYEIAGVAATTSPLGSGSTKFTPEIDEPFGFVIVNVSVEGEFGVTDFGLKTFPKPTEPAVAIFRFRAPEVKSAL